MRSILLIFALFLAQIKGQNVEKPFRYNGLAYGYYSYGSADGVSLPIGFGGGGEAFLWRGLAAAFDVGYQTKSMCAHCGITSAGGGVAYHFTPRNTPQRLDPFVSILAGGATNFSSAIGVVGYGGGVNVWVSRRVGVRVEVRGLSPIQYFGEPLGSVRFGVTLR